MTDSLAMAGDALEYPHAVPELDQPVELLPGLFWLRTSLPFALDHINLWLLDDVDGWTLIDTGFGNRQTHELWLGLLAGLLAGKPINRVLVTHFHPDHLGQAGWLCAHVGAPLVMARTEWFVAKALSLDASDAFVDAGEAFDRRAGLDEALIAQRRERGNLYRRGVQPVPPSFTRLQAGDELRAGGIAWRVVIGQGHAPEQVTLHSAAAKVLIAADQVLPKITPVIGVWPQIPDADPLAEFLHSLAPYREMADDTLVLPSHGRPFVGLCNRLDQLAVHHEERLARTLELAAQPITAAQLMRGLFTRPLTVQDVGFALAETLAHTNCLLNRGHLVREPAADGAWRYRVL